jgi:hypothetical protein
MFPHHVHIKLSPNFVSVLKTGDNRWAPDHGCMRDVLKILGAFQNCEKRLLALSSFRPPAWKNLATIGRISMKFDISGLFENLSRKFKFH